MNQYQGFRTSNPLSGHPGGIFEAKQYERRILAPRQRVTHKSTVVGGCRHLVVTSSMQMRVVVVVNSWKQTRRGGRVAEFCKSFQSGSEQATHRGPEFGATLGAL